MHAAAQRAAEQRAEQQRQTAVEHQRRAMEAAAELARLEAKHAANGIRLCCGCYMFASLLFMIVIVVE
jgi:hypothetical protein